MCDLLLFLGVNTLLAYCRMNTDEHKTGLILKLKTLILIGVMRLLNRREVTWIAIGILSK